MKEETSRGEFQKENYQNVQRKKYYFKLIRKNEEENSVQKRREQITAQLTEPDELLIRFLDHIAVESVRVYHGKRCEVQSAELPDVVLGKVAEAHL